MGVLENAKEIRSFMSARGCRGHYWGRLGGSNWRHEIWPEVAERTSETWKMLGTKSPLTVQSRIGLLTTWTEPVGAGLEDGTGFNTIWCWEGGAHEPTGMHAHGSRSQCLWQWHWAVLLVRDTWDDSHPHFDYWGCWDQRSSLDSGWMAWQLGFCFSWYQLETKQSS